MLVLDPDQKLYQTLPGQGWRALIVEPSIVDPLTPEMLNNPELLEEPVIAWVSTRDLSDSDAQTRVSAMTRERELGLQLLDTDLFATLFLAPGEERTPDHDSQLRQMFRNRVEHALDRARRAK